ncbi:hypothetical protein ABQE69_08945 [Mycolicibacillus trivialis]
MTIEAIQAWAVTTWADRARWYKRLLSSIAYVAAMVVAFQVAFPEVAETHSALFATVLRTLAGLGTWLGSAVFTKVFNSPQVAGLMHRNGPR